LALFGRVLLDEARIWLYLGLAGKKLDFPLAAAARLTHAYLSGYASIDSHAIID
jgi:hypothetical protein